MLDEATYFTEAADDMHLFRSYSKSVADLSRMNEFDIATIFFFLSLGYSISIIVTSI
jgi:hypothetical protein